MAQIVQQGLEAKFGGGKLNQAITCTSISVYIKATSRDLIIVKNKHDRSPLDGVFRRSKIASNPSYYATANLPIPAFALIDA